MTAFTILLILAIITGALAAFRTTLRINTSINLTALALTLALLAWAIVAGVFA